jgi:P-type E1-E2 ATPase
VGKFAYREAVRRVGIVSDPDDVRVIKGSGIWVTSGSHEIVLGNASILEQFSFALPPEIASNGKPGVSSFFVFFDREYLGKVVISDMPRAEAGQSLERLSELGIQQTIMLTGDGEEAAHVIAHALGISEYRSSVSPEGKLKELEHLKHMGRVVGMVGDGINDAPALARADVGIAMGEGAMAVATEAADIVILNNNLSRIPEMVELSRKTVSVIRMDVAIWLVTNLFGFALVLTGFAGPAIAALYNFLTDFLPLLNSTRLFKSSRQETRIASPQTNPFRI